MEKNVKRTILFLSLFPISQLLHAKLIYSNTDVSTLDNQKNYPLNIQLGSFQNKDSAYKLLRNIRAHHIEHVVIKPVSNQYKVIAGPFYHQKEAKAFYQSLMSPHNVPKQQPVLQSKPIIQPFKEQKVFDGEMKTFDFNRSSWYINADVGGQYPGISGSANADNGSGFNNPYNLDSYSIGSSEGSVMLDVGIGKRFELKHDLLQAISLGVQYQYFFSNNINGQITQFSLPEFTNYNYSYPIASHLVLATLKFNFDTFYNLSPFFKLGLGGSIMSTDGYKEKALANVTPRISPNFANSASSNFAYTIGAGIDYPLGQQFLVTAAYQYSDLGAVQSGSGQGSWSSQSLNFGRYQSNGFLFGGTYLFDFNHA